MNWLAIAVALCLFAIAGYTLSDPMSRARSWPTGDEWERDSERAREKQYRYTRAFAALFVAVGIFSLVLGIAG